MTRDDDLPAGSLTARITLKGPTTNEAGDEETGTAVLQANVPAAKKMLRGREADASGAIFSEQWTEFRIRWRSGLDSTTIVEHDGRAYNVQGIDDPTGNRRVLVITARAVR